MVELCLLAIGISLVVYSLIGIKKEGQKFDSVLDNEVNNLKKENLQIGAIRREVAESILDLQKEIHELREKIEDSNEITCKNEKRDIDERVENDYNNNRLHLQELVKERLESGKTIDDISSEFGIGRGEVLLIQGLKSK